MPGDLERIAQIDDPYELLRAATERLAEAQQEVTELARLRRRLIQDLHAQGMSYAQIANAAGLSRGRIHQIRHTGPAPEGAFLGSGEVTVVTPLRPDPTSDRTYVALDDLTTGKRLEELARTFDLSVGYDHVALDGTINLNRAGLLVICGPRMSPAMQAAYDSDPVIEWERDEVGWLLRDTGTGVEHRSGQEDDPARPYDVGYLGRLARPDGNGSFIAIAGTHPEGSLGVVHLLTTDIGSLWGQVGNERFSVVVGTEYTPDTHEPVRTDLLTPIYRHDQAAT
ncbi:sigma-70 family RNA polymerase sigma factor [Actinomadura fibrosa]|uniref:Sigma-70 family RNA polymerase sigma factor n=1 Tax=Actinomadura fibrosa TaxID=111802 RepID=A0ABW2XGT2_9ACTN|nr:sigma-70 family RNA polymerase sigma factor [Actinomadura fibrosa]